MTTFDNTRERLTHVIDQWLPMWNGDHDLVDGLVAPDFRIWFGNFPGAGAAIGDAATFREFLEAYRARYADAHFSAGEVAVDERTGRGALVWTVTMTPPGEARPRQTGGVDQFSFDGGRVRRVWSMGGAEPRPF